MEIKSISAENYPQVAEIYRQGIETGIATFQDGSPSWDNWNKSHLPDCRIAACSGDEMMGWAALTPVSDRCVYAGVAEVSIYVAERFRGKKIGEFLLRQLIHQSELSGLWTLQSGIFSENVQSIRLHEKCGFRKIGFREKIGQKKGVWKDSILMERRSKVVGI